MAYEYAMCRNKKGSLLRLQGSGRPYAGGHQSGLEDAGGVGSSSPNVHQAVTPARLEVRRRPNGHVLSARGGRQGGQRGVYSEKEAVADVKELAGSQRAWRCLVLYHDPEGKTALDRVVDMGQQFPLLRGELTGKHTAQAKRPELYQAARDLEQGWLQVQQNQ
ncbi:hypothetical protein MRS44_002809 [Fusarium solani]|uniref:uncharacterized protein n=1 Tax=Fusarium solani TaxID=169388 RepID=UPI0032C43AC2|nr:hypothetical protein MRS44_002809 [Fusarium solani]